MKIAVTYDNGSIFQHFGHTEQFMVYEAANGKIIGKELLSSGASGHGALAGLLRGAGVDVLVCGGIGGGAQLALKEAGIRLYGGVCGSADQAVEKLLSGTLAYDPEVRCEHHEGHAQGQECGAHSCAAHSCGH